MTQGNHPHARIPQCLLPHAAEYQDQSWKEHTLEQLGGAVAFFVQRSQYRTQPRKMAKDLYDAGNYLAMMEAHIEQHVADMGINMQQLEDLFAPDARDLTKEEEEALNLFL